MLAFGFGVIIDVHNITLQISRYVRELMLDVVSSVCLDFVS